MEFTKGDGECASELNKILTEKKKKSHCTPDGFLRKDGETTFLRRKTGPCGLEEKNHGTN